MTDITDKEYERIRRYTKGIHGTDVEWIVPIIYGYKFYKEMEDVSLANVVEYIVEHNLAGGGNKRPSVYKRAYMYRYITDNFKLSQETIGSLFNGKDHATVIHGLRLHKNMTETKDKQYIQYTSELREKFIL